MSRKTKKKNRRKGRFLMALGVILLLCSAALATYNYMWDKNADEASSDVIGQLKDAIDNGENAEEEEEKYITINGYDYIGYLSLPTINVENPIMADWDYIRLRIAPCRYYGKVKTHDLVIAGHNNRHGFGKLSSLNIGDEVLFTDAEKNTFVYRVGDVELLGPLDTKQMIDSEWDLSLYTCTYSSSKRLTIRCELVTETE